MPLSKPVLSNLIVSNMRNTFPAVENDFLKNISDAIADAVVEHITSAGLVTGVVTSGAGSGGSVTGTIN